MSGTTHGLSLRIIARHILLCFAIVVLSCAVKNYLVFLLQGSEYCTYACPSVFGRDWLALPEVLNPLFTYVKRIPEVAQDNLNLYWDDPHRMFSMLFVIPLVEESIYRGPLLFVRKWSASRAVFWSSAVILCLLFTFSHDVNGLLLLPILVFGFCSSWLISVTGRFWPSLVFHMLYNAYFLSVTLYQALFWSD